MIFEDMADLAIWLNAQGISTRSWGSGSTKTLENLWKEYQQGEFVFLSAPPIRVVNVLQVIIRRGDQVLIECEQDFGGGKKRTRSLLPSEKFKFGEDQAGVAVRCLYEELGLETDQIEILDSGQEPVEKFLDSPSYPGLKTKYILFRQEVRVSGLPNGDFWRDNAAYAQGDPVRRHKWGWRDEPESGTWPENVADRAQ